MAKFLAYVEKGPAKQMNERYADVFWALLNSGEFFLNH
jgi:hypothetical protein